MRHRLRNLCLLLALAAALTGQLQAKTLGIGLPADVSCYGQDLCLISLTYRAEIIDRIEMPPTALMMFVPENIWLSSLNWILRVYPEATPRLFSSADPCYLYMSLQR